MTVNVGEILWILCSIMSIINVYDGNQALWYKYTSGKNSIEKIYLV